MAKKIAISTLNASTLDILNTIRQNASYEYQSLVPEVTSEHDVPAVGQVLMGYPAMANQFLNALYQIMDWNPDYAYRVRGTWAKRGVDEIIVFPLTNSEPAAYMEVVNPETEQVRRRRTTLCPEEWNDSFGEEFYDYALENSFYYLAPRTDWNSQAKSIIAPGVKQVAVLSEEELQASIEQLKEKVE